MTRSTAALVAVALIACVLPPPVAAQDARGVAIVHARLLADGLDELERQHGRLQETWALVDAGTASVLEAQKQGASLKSLRDREDGLQQQEAQLLMRVFEVQRARRDLLTHLAVMEAAVGSVSSQAAQTGMLTGTWDLTVQPGLTGIAYLVQQGTLISGTYEMSGGWTGSLRGTLVANKVRLERIDSQLGFAAIFYGELNRSVDPPVIQGQWEATQMVTGLPSGGGWRAVRKD